MFVKCFGTVQEFSTGLSEPFDFDDSSKNFSTSCGLKFLLVEPPILQLAWKHFQFMFPSSVLIANVFVFKQKGQSILVWILSSIPNCLIKLI
jgi:hypothetical protein